MQRDAGDVLLKLLAQLHLEREVVPHADGLARVERDQFNAEVN